jgi:hypothetical protein
MANREPFRFLWRDGRDFRWFSFTPEPDPPPDGRPHPWIAQPEGAGQHAGFDWSRNVQMILDPQDARKFIRGGRTLWFRLSAFWPLFLSLPFPTLWLALRLRKRMRKSPGLCPTCGYDLRATPDRCPECGATPQPVAS